MKKTPNTEMTLRKYRVLYAVTRGEYYEVEATSLGEAEDIAFELGEFVRSGDATDWISCDAEEINEFSELTVL